PRRRRRGRRRVRGVRRDDPADDGAGRAARPLVGDQHRRRHGWSPSRRRRGGSGRSRGRAPVLGGLRRSRMRSGRRAAGPVVAGARPLRGAGGSRPAHNYTRFIGRGGGGVAMADGAKVRTVAGIMSSQPVTATTSETIAVAAGRMREERVGSVVVVDGTRPIGILTERDLVRFGASGADGSTSKVSEWMTEDPDTVAPEVEVVDAW